MGFFADRVSVHSVDLKVELASYQPNWMGTSGEIQFSTGELYTWNVTNYVATRFSISKVDRPELITFLSRARRRKFSNLFKQQAQVVISPQAWQIKELPILILLGWYLVLRHHEDAAVIAATASLGVLY
jgi:hypothetical protein